MTDYLIKFIANNGTVVEMEPTGFKPFNFEELISDKNSYDLKVNVKNVKFNGLLEEKFNSANGSIEFHHKPTPYALVRGGWLPLPFTNGEKFLVDRNVIENIKRIINGGVKHEDFKFWADFLNRENIELHPILYAFEGKKQRRPAFGEFIDEFVKAQEIISNYGFLIFSYNLDRYIAAYKELRSTESRYEKYSTFLVEIAPLLVNTVRRGEEDFLLSKLEKIRKKHLVENFSLVYVLALTYLFEDQSSYCLGRKILKLSRKYQKKNAYNSLSDLYNLEFSIAVNAIHNNFYILTTCDKGLAALWCALNPYGQFINEKLEINYNFDIAIVFPRLLHTSLKGLESKVLDILKGR